MAYVYADSSPKAPGTASERTTAYSPAREKPGGLGHVMVIAPHLNDAVFNCGELLSSHPHATVVTVFAGTPGQSTPVAPRDASCGFSSACEAMVRRRNEDAKAMLALSARPIWLNFLENQYRAPDHQEIRPYEMGVLRATLLDLVCQEKPDTVVIPLGLIPTDTDAVHRAMCAYVAEDLAPLWLAYEDAIYRRKRRLLQHRLGELYAASVAALPFEAQWSRNKEAKQAAVYCYGSQLSLATEKTLHDLYEPEQFWLLREMGRNLKLSE